MVATDDVHLVVGSDGSVTPPFGGKFLDQCGVSGLLVLIASDCLRELGEVLPDHYFTIDKMLI